MDLTTIILIGGGIVVIALIVGVVITSRSERTAVEDRLGKYLDEEKPKEQRGGSGSAALTDWVNRRVERSSIGETIARNLARADLKLKPGEYIALYVIAFLGLAFIAYLIGGKGSARLISALIGGVIGLFIPGWYVGRQKSKRLIKFNDQLPDMLNLMVNGLRAGFSTMQALESVSKEMPAPICDEFRRVVQEMQLGIPMERSLSNLLRRIPSEDLDFVITAINVQREVGGNLAEILDVITYTIRERIRIKGEIRVMTTQVMYSGKLLSLVPIGILVLLWFINRAYIMEFFKPENALCGGIALGVAAVLIVIGYFVMTRIANIEV
jgi:tight adherence protein B